MLEPRTSEEDEEMSNVTDGNETESQQDEDARQRGVQ